MKYPKHIELKSFVHLSRDEMQFCVDLRNQDRVRLMQCDTNKITLEQQIQFIEKLKGNANAIYFLVIQDGVPVGVCNIKRYDEAGVCDTGIYYIEDCHAHHFVKYYLHYLACLLGMNKIRSLVKKSNSLLVDYYALCKYSLSERDHDYYQLDIDLSQFMQTYPEIIAKQQAKGLTWHATL